LLGRNVQRYALGAPHRLRLRTFFQLAAETARPAAIQDEHQAENQDHGANRSKTGSKQPQRQAHYVHSHSEPPALTAQKGIETCGGGWSKCRLNYAGSQFRGKFGLGTSGSEAAWQGEGHQARAQPR
jgi:hypothetical protein